MTDLIEHPPIRDVKAVAEKASDAMSYLEFILKKHFGTFLANDHNPSRPIENMVFRVKTDRSMLEKLACRNITQKSEIGSLGDLVGARIVLKDAKSCDGIVDKFAEMARRGYLKITELENYSPTLQYGYASQKALSKLAADCKLTEPFNKTNPSGYTAIHLSVQLPDNIVGEIQIIGQDVAKFKEEVDDLLYKFQCNKLPQKYKPLGDVLTNHGMRPGEDLPTNYKSYIKSQYAALRQNELSGGKKARTLLPAPVSVPKELAFNNLAKIKDQCDTISSNAGLEISRRLFA